ncbi:MAG: ATP-binding protein [Thermodesulfovibrionales bacterium]|jgi:heavy metal sensor kinase
MRLRKLLKLRNTLAFRLTLWYAGIFTVSSWVAFFLFYTLITTVIGDRTDQDLQSQVNRLSTLFSDEGIEAVENGVVIEAQAAGVKKVFFRLLRPNGQVFSSTNVSYWKDISIDRTAIELLLSGRGSVLETIVLPNRRDKVRILYAMLSPTVIVQLGQSMESFSRFLDAFKDIFFMTMTFLTVVSAGVGWFMAKRAVSGVEAVTHTAQKISEGSLQERVPVKTRGDEIDRLATTFNNMLDRVQTLLTEIKEMSDNITHDLRSPITRIRGIAEVTLTTGTSLSEYEGMAASTIEECDRLLDMINTMLLISKTESGVDKLSHEEVDVGELVRNACELFTPTAEDKRVSLSCHAPGTSIVSGDVRMLQRMLSNILDNAVKYTLPEGKVEVSVSENEKQNTVVSVQDTGVGISEADLPRIFQRFYRCDQSRSEAGTGLGLSLARAVARAHGGDITVVSRQNQGSTFTIILPKAPPS